MRKGIRFILGAAAVAATLAVIPTAQAQDLGGAITTAEPAITLLMPFDVTAGRSSFEIVSRIGGDDGNRIATHWSFWSESCDHLADVFICLTARDTVVVDPTALQGQIQSGQTNVNTGPIINLTGEKGFITVTAFDADTNSQTCDVQDPTTPSGTASLVGSWVVANTATAAAFGNNAIGLTDPAALPDASTFFPADGTAGLFLQTFNPLSLEDSEIFFVGVQVEGGNASFATAEVGPIQNRLSNGAAMCCNAQYYDNLESFISLPDVCLSCAYTAKIAENAPLAAIELPALIPASIPAGTSGFVRLTNCLVQGADGIVPIEEADLEEFLFAFHGMAVGPFGTSALGRYTLE
jgi:hypothetical protein